VPGLCLPLESGIVAKPAFKLVLAAAVEGKADHPTGA
jgi:hypothetical protein